MKTIALIVFLGLGGYASAGYDEAEGAVRYSGDLQIKELNALLAQSGAALVSDTRAVALLSDNQAALELFRQAAEVPNDGYLFAAKPEKVSARTLLPKYGPKMDLFKLLLMDAKIKAEQKQTGVAEKDLLAAAGFLAQLSAQKSAVLISRLVEERCLLKAYPVFSDSLRGSRADPSYLKELAARLGSAAKDQDLMSSAMYEESERAKNTVLENVNPLSAVSERDKLPVWKRPIIKMLQDREYFSMVYAKFDTASDERARALSESFRLNDPAIIEAFVKKQRQELQARKQARGNWSVWGKWKDGFKGGPEAKIMMAEETADTLLDIAYPAYDKLVPRCHIAYCALNVLRSALAVKLYQRGTRRLPDSLDQLVPDYLPAVPRDSFNKFAPLSYIRTGKRSFSVYSFGPDGADDKGAAGLDYDAYDEDPSRGAGDILFSD